MGDKIRAKETVKAAGVPVVPGSSGSGLTDAQLAEAAREIGMPVLLKPSAGGGGKGMRLVRDAEKLADEIAAARREARASFGDDTLLVERWIDRPRHIEIQVLADGHGGVVHLGERECSLQRRHQKIVEEAPSVLLDEATRAAMGEAAVQAARSCGYRGAGTVEFIVPGGDPSQYYFMEMNTRLQVEHPVTELVTGLDLVEWQLRVAAGERLAFGQDDVRLTGHAVEARLCAEDPARGFLPSGGTVLTLREPQGDGVRTDSGLSEGTEVGSLYDPMLSKVIAYGPDRATALRKLRAALSDGDAGRADQRGLPAAAARPPGGRVGRAGHRAGGAGGGLPGRRGGVAGRGVRGGGAAAPGRARAFTVSPGWRDPFDAADGWRMGGGRAWTAHHLRVAGHDPVTVRVRATADGGLELLPPGADTPLRASAGTLDGHRFTCALDGVAHTFAALPDGSWLGRDGDAWQVRDHDPVAASLTRAGQAGADSLTAPMPGTVTVVKVAVGDEVDAGQSLLVVEAMKMEHVISAPHAGTVTELDVSPGTTVAMDQVLAVIAPVETAEPADPAEGETA